MSSKTIVILCIACAVVGIFLFKKNQKTSHQGYITIGILQTASHPALDQVREGFIHEMHRNAKEPIHFVVQNAEGSLSQAQAIASQFHSQRNIQAILAIGTPAVQAIARVEKNKPIFISAVSDPESLGILQSANICGTTDRINTEAQATLTSELLPHADTITILYSLGEANSQSMVHKIASSLQEKDIQTQFVGVYTESEIAAAVHTIARKSKAIIMPADNLLAGAMPLLVKETCKHQLPLIVSDPLCVFQGALAAIGADYQDLGQQTATLAKQVLFDNLSPETVGVQDPAQLHTVINQQTLDHLSLVPSEQVLSHSRLVTSEGVSHVR